MNTVTIYTTETCPFCVAAKNLLKGRGIPFAEVVFRKGDRSRFEDLVNRTGMKTVPQIFFGDRLIGGFQELSELDQKDALASLKDPKQVAG